MLTPTGRTALLLGASGLVGGHVLRQLAGDPRWGRVVTLGRRPLPTASARHRDHVVDFDRLEEQSALFACDDLLCCLGTTRKAAGSDAAFRHVDLDLPVQAAGLAAAAGAGQMLIVTAWGADPDSRLLYSRTKGEAEQAVGRVGFEALQILRPSLLAGDRDGLPRSSGEVRWGERIGLAVGTLVGPLLRGPLSPLRPIEAETVARAMVEIAAARPLGTHVYGPDALRQWGARGASPGG